MTYHFIMMHRWLRNMLDTLLPPNADVRMAQALSEETLARLLDPRAVGSEIVALFPYRDVRIRALIRAVKFHGEKLPLPALARVAGEYLIEILSEKRLFSGWGVPMLVPMPASEKRLRIRGYNQVGRFGEALSEVLGGSVLYAPHTLAREERKSQVAVPRALRADNIRGAFIAPDAERIRDRHIILLDDVIESGATMEDARRALRAAGVKDVIGIAIAR